MKKLMKRRPRRLRGHQGLRRLVQETQLSPQNFIYPLFVVEGKNIQKPIASMPGCFQFSVDVLVKEAKELQTLGLGGVLLFGIPDKKDDKASGAYAKDGIVQIALEELSEKVPDLLRISDVCLCEYMSHGHCGIVEKGKILNDASLELLAQTALSQVRAGSQMVAPSDMMDGRVEAIRSCLDANHSKDIPIMSYAVKYASAFYGPFREAADSAPQFGDRRSYQMDAANVKEALREAQLDVEEGADILMIKPAGYYLDIIQKVSQEFHLPVAAYQVSGEYSMIKAAAEKGWIDGPKVMMESLLGIRRAGAQIILTYFAKEVASLIDQ